MKPVIRYRLIRTARCIPCGVEQLARGGLLVASGADRYDSSGLMVRHLEIRWGELWSEVVGHAAG